MNWNDPIVGEIHQIRKQIWIESGQSLEGIYKHYVELQKAYAHRLVSPTAVRQRNERENTQTSMDVK